MKIKLHEWIHRYLPMVLDGYAGKVEAQVSEGRVSVYFHEWELRIELTPNKEIADRIIDGRS